MLPKENKAVFLSPPLVCFLLKIMEIFLSCHYSVFLRENGCEYSYDGGRFLVAVPPFDVQIHEKWYAHIMAKYLQTQKDSWSQSCQCEAKNERK